MRVLFSSTFGYGHMFPMYPLARAFLAAGHDVLWATSADARDRLEAAGLPAAAGRPGRSGAPRAGRQPAGTGGRGQPAGAGRLHVPPPVRRDADPADGGRPASPRDALAARPDGPRARRAGVAAGRCGAAGPERDARLRRRDPAEHAGGRRRPARAACGPSTGQALPPYAGSFTTLYLDICPPSVQSVPLDHVPARQPLRPVADTGRRAGRSPATSSRTGDRSCTSPWARSRTGCPCWAPAVAALARLPVRVLVTVGPDGDPDALGPQPDHVHVERWVDQPRVLRHCDVVVSHAGSGTFLGALAEGLPQLCLPQAADQFRNSEGATRAGVAARPASGRVVSRGDRRRGPHAPHRRRPAPEGPRRGRRDRRHALAGRRGRRPGRDLPRRRQVKNSNVRPTHGRPPPTTRLPRPVARLKDEN